jgi:allantoicase
MGDGWETARSRIKGHFDWAIIKLGAPGYIQSFIVDTAHFRGNYPQQVKLQAIEWKGDSEPPADAEGWVKMAEPIKCGPDQEHPVESLVKSNPFTHAKLIMVPDGGVKRLRVFAKRAA